jgi:hypothetical protein
MTTIPSYKLNQMLADLHRKGMSYGQIGGLLGLSRQAVFARIDRHINGRRVRDVACFKPAPAPQRTWCGQCERNVVIAEGRNCQRKFCKAEVTA